MESKRRGSSNSHGQLNRGIVDLPEEIISNILSRLPTETILICGVVCKTWYTMTQDPCFIKELIGLQNQPTRLIAKALPGTEIKDTLSHLVLIDIEKRKTRRIPIEKMLEDLQIMCSCNGLLCLASRKKLDPVVIYNPITRERVILPPSNLKSSVYRHEVGLGFDPSTGNYKVVRAYTGFSCRRKVRKFEIISLGESSWRDLNAPRSILNRDGWGVVFWKAALYWTMNKGISTIIVQFDLSDEKFRVISFPRYFSSRHVSLGLIEVGGHLTLVQNNSSVVKFWRITENEVGQDPSFCLQDTFDSHVKWGGGFCCSFVCQMDQESYLLQVGFWDCQHQFRENFTQYFPEKIKYSSVELQGLPESFKTVCFKPSLVPLPAPSIPSQ
ncbi:hypothetical protein U1Q18_027693 [Sarracenia purpurea var. burkii]